MSSEPKLALPIDAFLPSLLEKVARGNLVLTAEPGAGKTTRLPPALLAAFPGKILVLEPRRMAAIAAAHRIAEENGWEVGREVGYQVRFANKTSPETRLIFMTEALLARQMLRDPELNGVDAVVLDEFHERSLHVDLTLGLLRELQELGRALHLVVMSATLEAEKIATYLGGAPVVNVPGKLFELEIHYQKNHQLLQLRSEFYEQLFSLIKTAQVKTDKDLLVFLPGVGEIERARDFLSRWAEGRGLRIEILHGSLPLEEQRQVLRKSPGQRIILSTNIAESSVTLDGVNTVIDTGLAKIMRQDLRTGFSRLELSRISLSSAIQRSGRAARQFPGQAYRMWNKADELSFPKSETPEVLRAELGESLLFLAAQGVRDFQNFSWFEKPGAQNIESARRVLLTTGALNADNELTATGRKILHFPLPVRLAKLVLTGFEIGAADLAARLAALLQERDILRKEALTSFVGDQLECDLTARLEVLDQYLQKKNAREGHVNTLRTVAQSYQQILGLSREFQVVKTDGGANFVELRQRLLLDSYGDRLCRRRRGTDRALMVGGRGVKLAPDSLVKESEFFIALTGVESLGNDAETLVGLASGVDKNFLMKTYAGLIERKREVVFLEDKGQFFLQEFRTLWGLALEDPSLSPAAAELVAEKLPEILVRQWERLIKHNEGLAVWLERLRFALRHPDLLTRDLQAELARLFAGGENPREDFLLEVLSQAAMGERLLDEVMAKDLVYFFESALSPEMQALLREELPAKLQVPSGSWIRVYYPEDKEPYLEVRIQEIFGWSKTPRVLLGKIPVVIHLLGPNFRPVQITQDLESFWRNGYPEVRKELRLRYPKHQWPEDPAEGIPEAKGRRRH